nr:hypothetical protein Itr_chr02CG14350 [Ipomoea trifida]
MPERHRRRLPLGKMQLSHHRPMLCLEEGSRRNHAAATLRRHSRREVASEGRREIVEADRTSMPPPITRRDDRYCGGSVERERKATAPPPSTAAREDATKPSPPHALSRGRLAPEPCRCYVAKTQPERAGGKRRGKIAIKPLLFCVRRPPLLLLQLVAAEHCLTGKKRNVAAAYH